MMSAKTISKKNDSIKIERERESINTAAWICMVYMWMWIKMEWKNNNNKQMKCEIARLDVFFISFSNSLKWLIINGIVEKVLWTVLIFHCAVFVVYGINIMLDFVRFKIFIHISVGIVWLANQYSNNYIRFIIIVCYYKTIHTIKVHRKCSSEMQQVIYSRDMVNGN